MSDLTFKVPNEFVAEIAERAAEIMRTELAPVSPWLDSRQAAEYLAWPVERIYKHVTEVPHYKHGNRLMFRRDELDSWLERYRERAFQPLSRGRETA